MVHPSWSDYPHLLTDLDMTKNKNHTFKGKPIDVLDLTPGTNKKLDWKGINCNHEWKDSGNHRLSGRGCPDCRYKKSSNTQRKNNLESIGSMAVTHSELALEYQGDATIITAGTHKKLPWNCKTCSHEWNALGSSRVNGRGCPACAGQRLHSDGRNSMAITHPHLVIEYQGDATKVLAGTNSKLDWKCSTCKHEWKTAGSKRANESRCPACVNRVVNNFDGRNSMAITHPELALEYQGDATIITAGTHKKLPWKCITCEHEWKIAGSKRTNRGDGCSACAKYGFKVTEPAYCYLLKYQFSDGTIRYKQGITNNEVKYRKQQLNSAVNKVFPETKVTLIDQKYFETGQDALDLENQFKGLMDIRWTPKQNFGGSTEMYAEGILDAWAVEV